MIEAAKAGDLKAAEMILARIWPPRRGRPIRLELPEVRRLYDGGQIDAAFSLNG